MPAAKAPFLRFMESYIIDRITGCWIWTGALQTSGYGEIKCFGKMAGAHRLAYELYHGPIRDDLEVLHSCDNKICVNPDHLSAGTHQKNMEEAAERHRMASGERHPGFGKPSPLRGATLKSARPVMALGKIFGSFKEAEKHFDLAHGSVAYWIKTGNPKAKEMTREEYFITKGVENGRFR